MSDINEILWVAVPNGLKPLASSTAPPTQALIRVLMVPRLGEGSISDFSLDNWPERLTEAVEFGSIFVRTRLGNGPASPPVRPQAVSAANSDAWRGFFGEAGQLKDSGQINGFAPKTAPVPNVRPTYREGIRAHLTYRAVTRDVATPTANPDVDSAKVIRRQLEVRRWADDEDDPTPPTSDEPPHFAVPDFHATVSMLREHPRVLLDLGLIFELTVDIADIDRGTTADDQQLLVGCDDPGLQPPFLVSSWTRYDLDRANKVFRPAPAPGSTSGIKNGLLDLKNDCIALTSLAAEPGPKRWAIATFDIEGAVEGLRQTARDLAVRDDVDATMPPMRSAGLVLLRPDRQADFAARAQVGQANAERRSLAETVLSAEDLVLGYRVDIQRGDKPFRSVCERLARYTVDNEPIGAPPGSSDGFVLEEGHVKPFSAAKDANGNLHADNVVLRWDGWNLALLTPNLAEDTVGPFTKPANQVPYDFKWDYAIPPARLPALRFSSSYTMRVRIADLAGGGVPLKDDDREDEAASTTVLYTRHDPVQPPRLSQVGDFAAGAAIDRLVIRGDRNMTPQQLHDADPDYPVRDTRVLDPPTASLQLIEQHGTLDGITDLEKSFEVVQRALRADAAGSGLPDPVVSGVNPTVRDAAGLEPTQSERDEWTFAPSWPDHVPKRIELTAAEEGALAIDIEWGNDPVAGLPARRLQVMLGKAKQAIIELSSTVRSGMRDHLATDEYFDADAASNSPAISPVDTLAGRNPVVTPPRRILAVHAVKRPLADPKWNLPLTAVSRKPNDRTAVLTPTFTAVSSEDIDNNPNAQGLNTDSTGRLVVTANWTEFEDVGDQANDEGQPKRIENLHSQAIALGPPPEMRILHDFGDTKHRRVTYTLKATSRFREYFKDSEPEDAFQAILAQPEVNILSTARPADPLVIGVVPAFRWQRTQPNPNRIEHTRSAQRLRVELARPWFVTGEGEQLAVVVTPADNSVAADSELVTRIGRDPLFATAATGPRPQPNWFPSAAPASVKLPELNNEPVTVIPFDVTPSQDRWFADIDFTVPAAARSYNPFVQLAVARYQRDSLDGLVPVPPLSRVVVTEKVPLLPDRHVVVTRNGNQLDITVEGLSPNPLNRLEAILETCDAGVAPETVDLVVDDPATEPQVPAWRPVPGQTVSRNDAGAIPPLTLVSTPGRLRVRLRETERLDATTPAPPDLMRRNVFVDTIVLPESWRP